VDSHYRVTPQNRRALKISVVSEQRLVTLLGAKEERRVNQKVTVKPSRLDPSGACAPTWIDQPDALKPSTVGAGRAITGDEARQLAELSSQGYCVVRPAFEPELFTDLLADVESLWREQPRRRGFAYQSPLTRFQRPRRRFSLPSCRLADLHSCSRRRAPSISTSRSSASSSWRWASLRWPPSRCFSNGQPARPPPRPHARAVARPAHLLAAWVALEDIAPESGPLVYVPGSHRLPYYQFEPGRYVHDDRRDGVEGMRRGDAWDREQCTAAGLAPATFLGRRGEVLVWHHSLLHGGSVPGDPALTRRSFVIHYSSRGSMAEVRNSYLDPHSGQEGTVERRVLTTRRLLRAPGAVGFDSPLYDRFLSDSRQIARNGGLRLPSAWPPWKPADSGVPRRLVRAQAPFGADSEL
jgi:hypothetical protein